MVTKPIVQVITDSTSDVPRSLADALGIVVVPLTIHLGKQVYRDGVDITSDQFYERLRGMPTLAATAGGSPGAFTTAFREALALGKQVLCVTVSAKMSVTYQNALIAANEYGPERVSVVDGRTASMALGWLAVRAAEEARTGASLTQVRFLVERLLPHSNVYLTMDTLENLRRGGRIGRASAFLGTLLNIKPIITVSDGEVAPYERVRTMQRALQRLAEIARSHAPLQRLAVGYTDDPSVGEQLLALVKQEIPDMQPLVFQAGPIVGNYVGPGGAGVITLGQPD